MFRFLILLRPLVKSLVATPRVDDEQDGPHRLEDLVDASSDLLPLSLGEGLANGIEGRPLGRLMIRVCHGYSVALDANRY